MSFQRYVNLSLLLIVSVYLVFRIKHLDKSSKIFVAFYWIVLIAEYLAAYCAYKYHKNLTVYNVYGFFEFAMISLYFNYSIDTFRKHGIGIFIGTAGVLLGLLNMLFAAPLDEGHNLNYIFLECIGIISMSLYSFYRLLMGNADIVIYKKLHFWLPAILLAYWCSTFSYWGVTDYAEYYRIEQSKVINGFFEWYGDIAYTGYGIAFFLQAQKKLEL